MQVFYLYIFTKEFINSGYRYYSFLNTDFVQICTYDNCNIFINELQILF